MKRLPCLLLVLMLPASILAQSKQMSQPRTFAFTHVTVIDVTGAPPQPEMTVVITGDRITAIGKTKEVRPPKGAQVIDARGKFLIPGLWDMHVHLSFATEVALPTLIVNGVTGVRDLGSDLNQVDAWRREIASGSRIGPRIFRAGPLVDGPKQMPPDREAITVVVSNPDEARSAVTTLKQRGVDLIKIHNALPRDAFFALLDEARRQKLPVAAHLPRTGIRSEEASDAGVRSLEHTENLLESVIYGNPGQVKGALDALNEFTDEKAAEVFARFVKNGTWYAPQLIAYKQATLMREKTDKIVFAARQKVLVRLLQLVGLMQRAGVGLLAATDFTRPDMATRPGVSLHDELELLVEAGLTPMQALQAATLNPARSLDVSDKLGVIEKGKLADLVLLEANPLTDIRHTRRINAVMAGGRLIPHAELQKMRAQIEPATKR